MTDQPRLSERLTMAARAVDTTQPYPVYDARMNALYELVLDVAIPDLQALEAREERLTAVLRDMASSEWPTDRETVRGLRLFARAALAEPPSTAGHLG